MYTDPIADYLTRIRNASKAGHKVVSIPSSNTKKEITKILKDKGYILNFKFEEDKKQGMIKIALKYNGSTPAFKKIERISKPSLRRYSGKDDLPSVRGGLGVAIVSTSRGVMTDRAARAAGVGGEVLCTVF